MECKDVILPFCADLSVSLNRNIVECKDNKRNNRFVKVNGLNRNIVECKGDSRPALMMAGKSLNRNIVECKYQSCQCGEACNTFK